MTKVMKNCGISWIGIIPENWQITKVRRLFFRRKEINKEDNPQILSLARAGIKIRNISTNEGQLAENYDNYHIVRKNDLLLNPMDLISGANCALSTISGVISPAYINLANRGNVNPKYYDYYFKNQYWVNAMFIHGKGVSFDNRWTINNETIMNYYLPFPSLKEQNDIANFLDEKCEKINNIIEQNKNSIELMEEYKKELINEKVSTGLNENEFKRIDIEWIKEIPKNWSSKKMRFMGSFKSGLSNKKPEDFGFGTPFLTYKDVYKNYSFDATSELVNANSRDISDCNIKRGDIFFTGSSETIEELGLSSVCLKNIENGTYNGFCIRFRPYNENEIIPEFSKYYFRSHIVREFLVRNDNSVTRTNLSQNKLKNIIVLLPPKIDQKKIANFLDVKCGEIDKIIEYRKRIIKKLEEFRKSLIYEAVTGKIEV